MSFEYPDYINHSPLYVRAANHIINLEGLCRASKYSFVEKNETPKWWIQLVYKDLPEINVTLNNEKDLEDVFDAIAIALEAM